MPCNRVRKKWTWFDRSKLFPHEYHFLTTYTPIPPPHTSVRAEGREEEMESTQSIYAIHNYYSITHYCTAGIFDRD